MIPVTLLSHLLGSNEEVVEPLSIADFVTRLGASHSRLVDNASAGNWVFCIPEASSLGLVAVTPDFLGMLGNWWQLHVVLRHSVQVVTRYEWRASVQRRMYWSNESTLTHSER
jgi:hypothetical protein